jgi:hypothetical protein
MLKKDCIIVARLSTSSTWDTEALRLSEHCQDERWETNPYPCEPTKVTSSLASKSAFLMRISL